MIGTSKPRGGEVLYTTMLVAFDPVSGAVFGAIAHISSKLSDPAGVARSRERFLKDMEARVGGNHGIELLELAPHELPHDIIERVDPKTRRIVTAAPRHFSDPNAL